MAKNYTFAEAVKIINAGTDLESIVDIGRRYPILLHKVTRVAAKAGDDFIDLMGYMPDYLTANKVNSALKSAVGVSVESESESEDEDADVTEAEVVDTKATKEETEEKVVWNESMSGKQLWEILGKAGKRKVAKSTRKVDLIEACKQVFGVATEPVSNDTEETEEKEVVEVDETSEKNPYEGKSAMELFKECKKRGIKTAPKKTAKFYADLLIKADTEASKEDESGDSDEWDDDEEAAEEPKTAKKSEKKSAKKETTADDDDDWDI